MSSINIIFVRHGEAASPWQDHDDPGLSNSGRKQSKKLINNKLLKSLSDYDFISSPKKRAIETSSPLSRFFKKEVKINHSFTEIPSNNIEKSKKNIWLKNIVKIDKVDLPSNIIQWSEKVFEETISFKKNTIIFSHFMVLNSLVSKLTKNKSILCYYPEYTSTLILKIENERITSFSIDGEKKTHINL